MERQALAAQLSRRAVAGRGLDPLLADAVSDSRVIESCITCVDCGRREVDDSELYRVISAAADAEDFFELLDAIAETKAAAIEGAARAGEGAHRLH